MARSRPNSHTYSSGDTLVGGTGGVNQYITVYQQFFLQSPRWEFTNTSSQQIPNAQWLSLTFPNVIQDTDGFWTSPGLPPLGASETTLVTTPAGEA